MIDQLSPQSPPACAANDNGWTFSGGERVSVLQVAICAQSNSDIVFYNNGSETGRFAHRDGQWTFVGDADENARKFVAFVSAYLPMTIAP